MVTGCASQANYFLEIDLAIKRFTLRFNILQTMKSEIKKKQLNHKIIRDKQ